jgi:VWFA-related protein
MLKRVVLILILILLLYPALAQSQQPKPSPTPSPEDDVVRIDLNLVQVDAVVTDKNGRQVTNLSASDFSIIENGKSYVVDYCTYVPLADSETKGNLRAGPPSVAELGRTFVFLVDNPRIEVAYSNANVGGISSGSYSLFRRAVRGAVEAGRLLTWFVEKEMGPRDLVAIGDTEVDIGVLSSFTNDRAALHEAIERIRNNPTRTPIIRITSINGDNSLAELVKQNLRVMETVSNVIKQLETLPGRKVVTLMSRGMLFQPQLPGADIVIERMKKLIDQANRAHVSIYALSPWGVGNFGGDTLQNFDSLIHLANETGGRAIYSTNDTRVGFAEIVEKSRGYYMLAYKSEPDTHARPHALKVRLNRNDLQVEARATAYARAASVAPSPDESLRAAINSPLSEQAIPLELTSTYVPADNSLGHIDVAVKVSLRDADLVNTSQITKADFELALRVTGPDGKLLPPTIHQLAFRARSEERNHALQEGITTRIQIPVDSPGFYRISVAVQSKQTKELGSTNSLIEVSRKKAQKAQNK